MQKKTTLIIGWLYPELMSTYGDRGNIMVLQKRCAWRDIDVTVLPIEFGTTEIEMNTCQMIFGGGAQDRQQRLVSSDLRQNKGPILQKLFAAGIPGLFVCGSPQLLGHTYQMGDGTILEGLDIFDMTSKHFGLNKPRCIGNTVSVVDDTFFPSTYKGKKTIVGFENHGGRTYLGKNVKPFATVRVGFGNNGEDKTEGALYNNCIATYSHGPFLPKNPHIADWLIAKALSIASGHEVTLEALDDTLEWQAHDTMLKRLGY